MFFTLIFFNRFFAVFLVSFAVSVLCEKTKKCSFSQHEIDYLRKLNTKNNEYEKQFLSKQTISSNVSFKQLLFSFHNFYFIF